MSNTRIMMLFLAGAATGAAVALLTAPQSGRETRRKLKQATDDLVKQASRVGSAVQEAYRRGTEAGKEAFVHKMNRPAVQASDSVHSLQH
ncbi:MAG TPA: YtxH domain-containing protein [Candidatus Polarisedimenticolia bacterium]|jgi:gas vesicle protein|nr:YtxH domain-containing protein [Candidatus Polarisedimenticolia bacterium]